MTATTLTNEERTSALADLPHWRYDDGALRTELTFADFSEAFGFMARVALAAEKLDHHPDWSNSWNEVVIAVVSHAAGGVTAGCAELARRIDRIAVATPNVKRG